MAGGCDINRFVLFPEADVTGRPESLGLRYETIETTNVAGAAITGWLVLPADDPPIATVLLSHGNAGNIGNFLPWARMLAEAGYAAALYDYQGYGRSGGEADVASLAGDGAAVLDWLRARGRAGPGRPVGLMGLSLGTLVSIHLAAEAPEAACLVLEGGMIPGEELKRKFGVLGAPVAFVLGQQIPPQLRTETQIARVRCPVLFVHSADDEVTSLEGARELFALANEPKRFEQGPGLHLRLIDEWPAYRPTVVEFFNKHLR